MQYSFEIPQYFSLRSVLLSHGWSGLPPFVVSSDHKQIKFAFTGKSKPTTVAISQEKEKLIIESKRKLSADEIQTIEWMFGLNSNMSGFFDLAHQHDRAWIQEHHMGRMLRAETVFEDLIKLILTTNCTWSLTKKMVGDICVKLGEKHGDIHCFPTPVAIAKKTEAYFTNTVKLGYRAPYVLKIAKMVSKGALNVESWKTDARPYEILKKEILALPGAGPYVAENLLRLLGKYDGLGVDSWVRGQLQKMWNNRKQPDDKKILKQYKKFGEYKGLILWCDVTRSWHDGTGSF
jgi:3-methyladenine DNA glycosylase/8-oxoguanine DNA glycosylase